MARSMSSQASSLAEQGSSRKLPPGPELMWPLPSQTAIVLLPQRNIEDPQRDGAVCNARDIHGYL